MIEQSPYVAHKYKYKYKSDLLRSFLLLTLNHIICDAVLCRFFLGSVAVVVVEVEVATVAVDEINIFVEEEDFSASITGVAQKLSADLNNNT